MSIDTRAVASGEESLTRCEWANGSELMAAYHDLEWGKPVRDEQKLFEYLVLDGFQAGLSWSIVLRKREALTSAFCDFDPEAVAGMTENDVERLMGNSEIIRNRAKIRGTICNARALLSTREEMESFGEYIWSFTNGETIQNQWISVTEVPAQTAESVAMSKDLKKRGFYFVGPTIIYAVMQSAGMVNDHVTDCFRHAQLS